MKKYKIAAALTLAGFLSLPAAAADVIVDPLTGAWHVTTGAVYGVGTAAVNTWNDTVHYTTGTVNRVTDTVTPKTTTVRHTNTGTRVYHHR